VLQPIKMLYKGTLRVLLVLLHDFPEFLCEYHSSFCDCIPTSCIQLRNLILSAFPRNMTLPDPLMPQLKVPANTRQALPLRTYASHSPGLASRTLSQPLSVVAVAVSLMHTPRAPAMQVDRLSDMSKPPTILSNLTTPLCSNERFPNLKSDLDNFLRGAARDSFLKVLLSPPCPQPALFFCLRLRLHSHLPRPLTLNP
jgi:hypothetical protein